MGSQYNSNRPIAGPFRPAPPVPSSRGSAQYLQQPLAPAPPPPLTESRSTPLPLSAIEEHYLKRELIRAQLHHELDILSDFRHVGRLGYPFKSPTNTALNDPNNDTSMPILRHVFAHHIRTFPFIANGLDKPNTATTRQFWQNNVQRFLEIWGEKELSSSEDREEATKRKKMGNKLTSLIAIYMSSGLQTTNPDEKTSKVGDTGTRSATNSADKAQKDGAAAAKSGVQSIDPEALARELSDAPNFIHGVDLNVVGVHMVSGKKKAAGLGSFGTLGGLFMVSDDHAEFIIRSRMAHPNHNYKEAQDSEYNSKILREIPVIYVSRRFSDFQELNSKLEKEFTGLELPRFPAKNKTSSSLDSSTAQDMKNAIQSNSPFKDDEDDLLDDDDDDELAFDEKTEANNQHANGLDMQSQFQNLSVNAKNVFSKKSPSPTSPKQQHSPKSPPNKLPVKLLREKQRLSFRAYLRALLKHPAIAKSQTLLEFLFRDQLRSGLTQEQSEDMANRRLMDIKRVEDQLEFLRLATARARELEVHMTDFKRDLMEPGGLQNIFMEIRTTPSIDQLSPRFKLFLEWASVEFSATLYSMFVAEDSSPDLFNQITRIHRLMPYSVMKGILRWSNPVAIMKGIIDLFLAQPFGKRSLLQNIFYMVLQDDIKSQDKQINTIKKALSPKYSEVIAKVFEGYLKASLAVREEIRGSTKTDDNVSLDDSEGHTDLLVAIFKNARKLVPDGGPAQDEVALLVEAWYEAWNAAVEQTKPGSGNTKHAEKQYPNDYVNSYTSTRDLLHLMMRRDDKDKLQALWNEPETMSLVRDLFTIFYSPLVELFKTAKIHEAVGDFESFMDDLIKVVKRSETTVLTRGANEMVEEFVNLCHRHLPQLYRFVHEMYVNDKGLFFDGIMRWLSDIVQFLRYGYLQPTEDVDGTPIHHPRDALNSLAHQLDLNKVVKNSEQSAGVNPSLVVNEIDGIILWLQKRKDWMKQQENLARDLTTSSAVSKLNSDWSSSMPMSGGLGGDAFGLVEDDLDTFEMEGEESDDDDQWVGGITPGSPASQTRSFSENGESPKSGKLRKFRIGHRRDASNSSATSSNSASGNGGRSSVQQAGLEAERDRREKLLRKLENSKKMPKRPTVEESLKLRREFAKELTNVLFVA